VVHAFPACYSNILRVIAFMENKEGFVPIANAYFCLANDMSWKQTLQRRILSYNICTSSHFLHTQGSKLYLKPCKWTSLLAVSYLLLLASSSSMLVQKWSNIRGVSVPIPGRESEVRGVVGIPVSHPAHSALDFGSGDRISWLHTVFCSSSPPDKCWVIS
jgi:hypothetical protein